MFFYFPIWFAKSTIQKYCLFVFWTLASRIAGWAESLKARVRCAVRGNHDDVGAPRLQ